MKQNTQAFKKIVARIDITAHNRLSEIRDKYGFKSNYQIVQYLVSCFLRTVLSASNDEVEALPLEIKDMFRDYTSKERQFEFIKPKRIYSVVTYKKVVARISTDVEAQLVLIRDRCGFKSIYEIIQYVVACFLRVADPDVVEELETIQDEAKGIFYYYSEGERHFEYVKPKRAINYSSLNALA